MTQVIDEATNCYRALNAKLAEPGRFIFGDLYDSPMSVVVSVHCCGLNASCVFAWCPIDFRPSYVDALLFGHVAAAKDEPLLNQLLVDNCPAILAHFEDVRNKYFQDIVTGVGHLATQVLFRPLSCRRLLGTDVATAYHAIRRLSRSSPTSCCRSTHRESTILRMLQGRLL
jgi:hypothetical protein